MLLERLGIYGWPERQENLLLTSLLTGDPLLLIGPHGCAKTYLASRVAQALGRRFMAYDASKAMFEDVLGYPNLENLKQGMVDYVPGPLTIWDKEMILIDELNRALPELQSKWLEIVRSRRIMGLPTRVRWVWAAMNPNTYTGTQELDQALLGRFALYVYPPGVLEMSEADRIKVTQAMSDDDAPALREWLYADRHRPSQDGERTSQSLTATVPLAKTLHSAARHYGNLREDLWQLPLFLSRLAELLRGESQGQIRLDGRRLGFLYRNIRAYRAIELAKVELGDTQLSALADSVRLVITASIPLGLDDTLTDQEKARHQLEICCDARCARGSRPRAASGPSPQLPRPGFRRLADDSFQGTPAVVRQCSYTKYLRVSRLVTFKPCRAFTPVVKHNLNLILARQQAGYCSV